MNFPAVRPVLRTALAAASVLAWGCTPAPEPAPGDAVPLPPSALASAWAEASADTAPAKPAAPAELPKPRRTIVDGVEVVVNIPSGRLELVQDGRVVESYPVSVGRARYATPVGDYLLATVIWNPWWHPPKSAWARNSKPTPPGPGNPMGRVKLNMDGLYYIHGTTEEGRLGEPASHGCVRMANRDAIDLANRLRRLTDPDVSDETLDRLAANDRKTRHTVMPQSVRMRVTYQVARVSDDRLEVYPDVYRRLGAGYNAQVRKVLAEAGFDPAQLSGGAMARLRAGARSEETFALADLPSLRAPTPRAPEPARPALPAPEVKLLGTPVPAEVSTAADDAGWADAPALGEEDAR